jgi:hypothetical protein
MVFASNFEDHGSNFIKVGVGDGAGVGVAIGIGEADGEGEGVGVADTCGVGCTTFLLTLQTSALPFLTHVYFFPETVVICPTFLQAAPGLTAAEELLATNTSGRTNATNLAIRFISGA